MTGNTGHVPDPTLEHVLAHLAKYTGKLAEIVEHLGHPDDPAKVDKARRLARRFIMEQRDHGIRWCAGEAKRLLREVGFDREERRLDEVD